MDYLTIIFFIAPVLIVLGMHWFRLAGWKTYAQGVILTIFGGVQGFDWSFLPSGGSVAWMTGAGIAVLLASKLTNREKST